MAEAVKEKPIRKALGHHMQLADVVCAVHVLTPEPGTTLEEILRPEYWANVASRLNVNRPDDFKHVPDVIRVCPADSSWYAELLVVNAGALAARVVLKEHIEIAKIAAAAVKVPTGYKIEHRGKGGWRVTRVSDGAVLKDGFESEAAAVAFAETQAKAFA